jgi:hypothetical protein
MKQRTSHAHIQAQQAQLSQQHGDFSTSCACTVLMNKGWK